MHRILSLILASSISMGLFSFSSIVTANNAFPSDRDLKAMIVRFYNKSMKGQYRIGSIEKLKVVKSKKDKSFAQIHVKYYFSPLSRNHDDRATAGNDQRIFYMKKYHSYSNWEIVHLGKHMSAEFYEPSSAAKANYNVLGLKLNMTLDEAQPILNKMKEKGFNIRESTRKANYLKTKESYIENILASRPSGDTIFINFFMPPHKNTISKIGREKKYKSGYKDTPYPGEIINFMSKKFGKVMKKFKSGPDGGPLAFWSDYACMPILNDQGFVVSIISDRDCGLRFSFSSKVVTDKLFKDKVKSYSVILSDETAIKENWKEVNRMGMQLEKDTESLRLEDKRRKTKKSNFNDDL